MKDKMNVVLAWVKGNVVSVVCLAIAVIALPTMYVFGSRWGAAQRTKLEADVKKQVSDLSSAKVDYALEPVMPLDKPFSISMPPNEATTEQMRVLLVKTGEQVGGVRDRVVALNSEGKAPLIEGLFPKPEQAIDEPALAEAMAKGFAKAHEDMLRRLKGGEPPAPDDVEQRLKEVQFREQQAIASGRADGKLTPEDEADLTRRLTAERMQIYAGRALGLNFYASPAVFEDVETWKETTPPSLEQCFEWQWLLWVHEDLLRAVVKANEGESLIRGAVKRIERVRVEPMTRATATMGDDATAPVPSDPSKSLSGRVGPNGLFDIRVIETTMLVSSAEIPRLLDAIATTNLMTVIGFDVSAVEDLAGHLRAGYVYTRGSESVVRVRMRIETLWLRDWMGKWMPEATKSRLGFAGAAPPEQGALPGMPDPANSPPPPPPTRGDQAPERGKVK